MMTVNRTFNSLPDEFSVSVENSTVLCAEWREGIVHGEDGRYSATCRYVPTCQPLTFEGIVELLASCRYTPGEEVSLMRREITDPERVAHEEYIERVKAYAEAVMAEFAQEAAAI